MNICFVISNMEYIDDTWSTTHLAHEALKRGNSVAFVESTDFEVTAAGRLVARASYANEPWPERTAFATALSNRALQRRYMEVSQFDLMMVRVNPLNLSTLSFLLMAQETGVPVVNDPVGIVRTRSKAWLASLQDVPSPETIVTHYTSAAVNFYDHLRQSVVVKPTQASGGRGVSLVRARRPEQFLSAFRSALAIAAGTTGRMASGQVVVQAYVSEAKDGEKRLVWVDGMILGAYLRKRKVGEFRHNLKQGAQPCSAEITPTDQRISDSLSPHLLRNGIRFAGLDVIGSLLIEVNTLNPGGIHFADCFRSPATPSIGGLAIEKLTGATPTPL